MKWTSPALAAALASALVLTSCTAEGTDGDAASGTGAVTSVDGSVATGDVDAVTSTGPAGDGDAATSTGDGSVVTAAPEGQAVVSVTEAERIASDLLTKAAQAQTADAEQVADLQEAALGGAALEASRGAAKLRALEIPPSIQYAPANPNVLAVSRDDGSPQWSFLVQTVPESGLPQLHEIRSDDGGQTWWLTWSAPMLPGTQIGQFDRRSEGTPVTREGEAGPEQETTLQAVQSLLDYVAYPLQREEPQVKTYGYAPAVREQLDDQADAVQVQADFTNTHDVRENSLRSYQLADGSLLTLVVVDRDSVFDVLPGMELTPPETFTAFVDDRSITEGAKVDSLLFFAMHVPAGEGVPELIAAREQVVGASGE